VEAPLPLDSFGSGENICSGGNRCFDLLVELVADCGSGKGTELGLFVHRISDPNLRYAVDELLEKPIVNRLMNDEALGRNAGLAVVDHPRRHLRSNGSIDICAW